MMCRLRGGWIRWMGGEVSWMGRVWALRKRMVFVLERKGMG